MASTFKTLADKADWSEPEAVEKPADEKPPDDGKGETTPPTPPEAQRSAVSLHHDVHVHLPPTSDVALPSYLSRAERRPALTDESLIRDWLFKGLSVEDMLDALEGEGLAVRAADDPGAVQRIMPLEDFSADIHRSALQALPAYLAFFCLENAVRELVVERMTDAKGTGWWSDGGASADLKKKVEGRQEKEGATAGTFGAAPRRSTTRTSAT